MKFRPEAGSIVVKSAEGVLVMQTSYIEKLENRVGSLEKQIAELTEALKAANILITGYRERHPKNHTEGN